MDTWSSQGFGVEVKSRWAEAYKTNFDNATRPSLAEAAQTSMRDASGKIVRTVN